ncbi:hypothetical protein ACO0SA_004243 [Hanseniaspora valbyensis]
MIIWLIILVTHLLFNFVSGKNIVEMDLINFVSPKKIQKRKYYDHLILDSLDTFYLLTFYIGKQKVTAIVDTGSGTLNINICKDDFNEEKQEQQEEIKFISVSDYGSCYNPDLSEKLKFIADKDAKGKLQMKPYEVSYGDGEKITGVWAKDQIYYDISQIHDLNKTSLFHFGIIIESNQPSGYAVLGLGIVQDNTLENKDTASLPLYFYKNDIIKYSIYFISSNKQKQTGKLIFGGINHNHYKPYSLKAIKIINSLDLSEKREFFNIDVPVTKFSIINTLSKIERKIVFTIDKKKKQNEQFLTLTMDTGSSFSYLPDIMFKDMINNFDQKDIKIVKDSYLIIKKEKLANFNLGLEIGYNISFEFPFFDICLNTPSRILGDKFSEYDQEYTLLPFLSKETIKNKDQIMNLDRTGILGLNILKNIFFGIDLKEMVVILAEPKYDNDEGDIEEITSKEQLYTNIDIIDFKERIENGKNKLGNNNNLKPTSKLDTNANKDEKDSVLLTEKIYSDTVATCFTLFSNKKIFLLAFILTTVLV